MKNFKQKVDIVQLVDEFISIMNKRCEDNSVPSLYEVGIREGDVKSPNPINMKKGKSNNKFKTLRVTVSDLNTHERLTLFSVDYVYHNPSELLTSDYKKVLYREFLFNTTGMFLLTSKEGMQHRQQVKRDKVTEEHPIAMSDVIDPKDFSAVQ